jgi:hypothetical protein
VLTFCSVVEARELLVIGWSEYLDIPDWEISGLRAKVDTGARTSALHVENIHEIGGRLVRFDVRLHRWRSDRRVTVVAPVTRRTSVRPTSGSAEMRLFVSTRIRLGPVETEIELGLVDRRNMIFRLLIGRAALAGRFIVDVARKHVVSHRPTSHRVHPSRGS